MTDTTDSTAGTALTETEILDLVREKYLADPAALDMGSWHRCETTHCLAGWCEVIVEGRQTDDALVCATRHLPITHRTITFFASNHLAAAWLTGRCYAQADPLAALADEYERRGGLAHRDGDRHGHAEGEILVVGGRLIGQTGGVAVLYDSAQSHAQAGGAARLSDSAQSHGQTGGEVYRWQDDRWVPIPIPAAGDKAGGVA